MSFSPRLLFLAGLLLAAACSDAGTPVAAGAGDAAGPEFASTIVQALTCTVDEVADTFSCAPASVGTGSALGAVNIGNGNAYVVLTRSNEISTPDSAIFDVTFTNVMNGQVIGTVDGVTPHSSGLRFFFYDGTSPTVTQPRVLTKADPAQPASITPVSDGTRVFTGAGSTPRHYFQYAPQVLYPGTTSMPRRWKFAMQNVATWTFTGYLSTEVQFPKGWLDIIPTVPTLQLGSSDTLTAQVRNVFGRQHRESLNWSSSNPAVVSVTELAVDSLAQVTGGAQGTAWVKAASVADPANRRDSVLVTVN